MKWTVLISVLFPTTLVAQSLTGTVTGRITSATGTPLADVRVIALETSYPRLNIGSQAQTDRNGSFTLSDIAEGEYFIVADPFQHPGYFPGVGNRDKAQRV